MPATDRLPTSDAPRAVACPSVAVATPSDGQGRMAIIHRSPVALVPSAPSLQGGRDLCVAGGRHRYETRDGAVEALERIDLHPEAGDLVGFVGQSGCGKTTLLQLLAGLLVPTDGVTSGPHRPRRAAAALEVGRASRVEGPASVEACVRVRGAIGRSVPAVDPGP